MVLCAVLAQRLLSMLASNQLVLQGQNAGTRNCPWWIGWLFGWTRMSPGTTLACQHNPCSENKPWLPGAWPWVLGHWPLWPCRHGPHLEALGWTRGLLGHLVCSPWAGAQKLGVGAQLLRAESNNTQHMFTEKCGRHCS